MRTVGVLTKLGSATMDVDDLSAVFDERGDYWTLQFKSGLQLDVYAWVGRRVRLLWLGEMTVQEWEEGRVE